MNKFIFTSLALSVTFMLASFTMIRISNDFLKQLGITQAQADEKITESILGGYLDAYGVKNVKNIALGNRTAVANDLLTYTKKHTASPAFIAEYRELKQKNKPESYPVQTPEELKNSMLESYRKSLVESEKLLKTSDEKMKPVWQKLVDDTKKYIAEIENSTNKSILSYTKNYPAAVKSNEESYQHQLARWDEKYPPDHMKYVKRQLERFMDETENIDYSAELVIKNNKKKFVNPEYERKSSYWKMAFRAGKEVTEPARKFVSQWLLEIGDNE